MRRPIARTLSVVAAALALAGGTLTAATAQEHPWSQPTYLSPTGMFVGGYDVGVSPSGDTTVVWGDGKTIQTRGRPHDGSWSDTETLAEGPADTLSAVAVTAAADDGTVVAAWLQKVDAGRQAMVAVKRDGVWGEPYRVSAAGQVRDLRVTGNANGSAVLVWAQSNGVRAARMDSVSFCCVRTVSGAGTQPAVAMDRLGAVYVAWQENSAGVSRIRAVRGTADGVWGEPRSLSRADRNGRGPDVAVDAQGSGMVVWTLASSRNVVQVAHRPAGGSWTTATTISDLSRSSANPQVALDARGSAVALWTAAGDDEFMAHVVTARRPSGGSWGGRQTLSTRGEGPQLGMDAAGNAVATWIISSDIYPFGLMAADRPAGGAWGSPQRTPWNSHSWSQRTAVGAGGTVAGVVSDYNGGDGAEDIPIGAVVRD